jgi:hypothetical protein
MINLREANTIHALDRRSGELRFAQATLRGDPSTGLLSMRTRRTAAQDTSRGKFRK